jgi:hypothetical protein
MVNVYGPQEEDSMSYLWIFVRRARLPRISVFSSNSIHDMIERMLLKRLELFENHLAKLPGESGTV